MVRGGRSREAQGGVAKSRDYFENKQKTEKMSINRINSWNRINRDI